jgi:hypothetical protein
VNSDEEDTSRPRFSVELSPYSKIERDLREGLASQIDPADLALEIRTHGIEKMSACLAPSARATD